MPGNNPFTTRWSRSGNLLAHGHWQIHWFGGQRIALPESRQQKDRGTREICPIIDPAFAQGLPEDEWIIDNVDWLTGLFFENGVPLETAIIATLNLP